MRGPRNQAVRILRDLDSDYRYEGERIRAGDIIRTGIYYDGTNPYIDISVMDWGTLPVYQRPHYRDWNRQNKWVILTPLEQLAAEAE